MPRGEIAIWDDTVVAEGAITDRAAIVQGTSEIQGKIAPATNSPKFRGISMGAAVDGQEVAVRKIGVAEALAAGVVSIGDLLVTSGSAGRLESLGTLSPGTGSVKNIVAEAQTAATAAGDIIEVRVLGPTPFGSA